MDGKTKRKNSPLRYTNLIIAAGFFLLAGMIFYFQNQEPDLEAAVEAAIAATQTASVMEPTNRPFVTSTPPMEPPTLASNTDNLDEIPQSSPTSGEGFSLAEMFPLNPWGFDADLSPHGTHIAYSDINENVVIWEIGAAQQQRFSGSRDFIWSLDWSPDGRYVAAGSGDGRIYVWDTEGDNSYYLDGHYELIHDVDWSPDGNMLASISLNKLYLWDTEEQINLYQQDEIVGAGTALDWSPDGTKLLHDGLYVNILPVAADGTVGTLRSLRDDGYLGMDAVVWSPDGSMIANSGNRAVYVWDAESGEILQRMFGTLGDIEDVAWSPDGRFIASVGDDRALRIWDVQAGVEIAMLDGLSDNIETVQWTGDGQQLMLFQKESSNHSISLWNFELDEE